MRTTLVIPTYNHAHFLPVSVGSVLAQTRAPDEVLIYDDASEDDTALVLDRLVGDRPAVRVVRRQRNLGVVGNLNAGLAEATGDLVAFLGADDWIAPDFLERAAATLESDARGGFAAGCAEIWDGKGRAIGLRPLVRPRRSDGFVDPHAYRALLRTSDHHLLPTATLWRTSVLRDAGGFDPALGALCDGLVLREVAGSRGFHFMRQVLGAWRNQGGNYSMSAMTDAAEISRLFAVARSRSSAHLDPAYLTMLERRLRFGGIRLLADGNLRDECVRARISALAGSPRGLAALLALAARLPPRAASLMIVAGASLRMRPVSYSALVMSRAGLWLRPLAGATLQPQGAAKL